MLEANLDALRCSYPDVRFVASWRNPCFTEKRYGVQAIRAPFALDCRPARTGVGQGRQGLDLGEAIVEAVRRADGLIVSGGGNLCATWPGKLLERQRFHCAADVGKPAVVVGQTLVPS